MKRVLLVDDEPRGLEPLRESLAQQRPEWQLVLVGSGAEALLQLAQQPFDAVVSDLAMPGMDGPMLLAQVREQHPDIVRLCLSDTADDEAFVRAMPVTHQFVGKSCDPDALCEVLERAVSVRNILHNDTIRALIGKLNALPSTPQTFRALSSAMSQPNAHTADITQIVSKDTSLSIKVLQIVNSAFFRRGAPITSIQQAITFMGLELIRALALSARVFNALDANPQAARLLADLQARSCRKAQFARLLLHDSREADEAFTAALLLDIGEAVLALGSPAKFEQMLNLAATTQRPRCEVEAEMFGVSHPEVGAYLLSLWGLPLELIEAVAYHHAPSGVQHEQTRVLAAIHVADAVVDATADQPSRLLDRLDASFVARTEVARCLEDWNIDTDADALAAQRRELQ